MNLLSLFEALKALVLVAVAAVIATVIVTVVLLARRHGVARSVNGGCLLGALPLIVAGVFLAVAAGSGRMAQTIYSNGATSSGRVVLNRKQPGRGEYYVAVIEFEAPDGRTVRFDDLTSAYPPRFNVGDKVEVVYQRDAVERALIRDPLWWLPTAIFLALAIAAWIVVFALAARGFRKRTLTILDVISDIAA